MTNDQRPKKKYCNKHTNGNATLYTYLNADNTLSYYLTLAHRKGTRYHTKTMTIENKEEVQSIIRCLHNSLLCPKTIYQDKK